MSVNTGGLSKGFKNARGQVQGFTGAVNVSGKALAGLALKAAAVLGPFIAFSKIISGIKDSMSSLDRVGKFADEVGLTVDELRSLSLGAELTGSNVKNLEKGLQRMTRRIGEAKLGFGEGTKGLEQLGLKADELTQLSTYEALGKISDAIQDQPDAASKAAAAYSLFGRQGQELLTFLDQGKEGMDAFKKTLLDTQGSIDRTDISKIEMANDAITIITGQVKALYDQLAIELAPIITAVAKKFTELGSQGMSASQIINTGMKWTVKAIGIAADVVDVFHDLWGFLQAGVTKAIGLILQGVATLGRAIQTLANKLPGVEVAFGDTLQAMADGVNELADEQWKKAKQEFIKPPPSEGIKKFFNDIQTDAQKAAEALRKNRLGQNTTDINKPAYSVIDSLLQQIEVLKLGADQAKLNELRAEGVSEAMLKQVAALQSQKKALEESNKATEELRKQQEKLKTDAEALTENFKSPLEKFKTEFMRLKELLDKGLISKDTFKSAALDALPDKVKSIIEKTKTPTEKFQEQLKELQTFKNAGLLTDEQFKKAKIELSQELKQTGEVKLASAAEFGSQEARSAILKNRLGNRDPMKDALKVNQEQLEEQKKMTPLLAKIATNSIEVVSF